MYSLFLFVCTYYPMIWQNTWGALSAAGTKDYLLSGLSRATYRRARRCRLNWRRCATALKMLITLSSAPIYGWWSASPSVILDAAALSSILSRQGITAFFGG